MIVLWVGEVPQLGDQSPCWSSPHGPSIVCWDILKSPCATPRTEIPSMATASLEREGWNACGCSWAVPEGAGEGLKLCGLGAGLRGQGCSGSLQGQCLGGGGGGDLAGCPTCRQQGEGTHPQCQLGRVGRHSSAPWGVGILGMDAVLARSPGVRWSEGLALATRVAER